MATTCPGPYLYSKFPYIAAEVNKKLASNSSSSEKTPEPAANTKLVVDGYFGNLSTRRLQSFLGLTPDGWVGGQTETVRRYLTNWTTVKYNDGYLGSTTIDRLQRFLKNKGYNPGTIDGLCGKQTVKALQKFLNAQGCDVKGVDGYFGLNTAKAFQKFLNK